MTMTLTFVTGNAHKAEKTSLLIGRPLQHQKLDLDEIQTMDLTKLVEHKVRQAYELIKSPVIVDDFGFCLGALYDLPGPFTKFFVEPEGGDEKLCRIADILNDRSASIVSVVGYFDGKSLEIFEGTFYGKISDHPKGKNGIGTDRIFIPDGYNKTRAQMDDKEYNEFYEKFRPFDKLRDFLNERDLNDTEN